METYIKNSIDQFDEFVACKQNVPRNNFDKLLIGKLIFLHNYWLHDDQLLTSPLKAFERCNCFNRIYILLQILTLFLTTNAIVERKFSSLQRVKT